MKKILIILLFSLSVFSLHANNIRVSNVSLHSQNIFANTYMVQFDLAWDNSWRTSTYESNWDAAWVFVKFTNLHELDWQHAELNYVNGIADGHVAPAGATIRTTPDGVAY